MKLTANLALIAAAVGLGVVAVGQQVYISTRPEPADVLHYPVQRVLSRVGESDRPTVLIGSDLLVQGTKCNDSTEPVAVAGVTSWVSVDPPGTTLDVGHGNGVRPVGCETRTYSNPIPDVIATRTRDVTTELHTKCVTWRITGKETPTDPLVLPVVWTSEPVDVCVSP